MKVKWKWLEIEIEKWKWNKNDSRSRSEISKKISRILKNWDSRRSLNITWPTELRWDDFIARRCVNKSWIAPHWMSQLQVVGDRGGLHHCVNIGTLNSSQVSRTESHTMCMYWVQRNLLLFQKTNTWFPHGQLSMVYEHLSGSSSVFVVFVNPVKL